MFPYDVAISFAGEQRMEAEAIAACLKRSSIKVFYDGYEQATLWGKDLYEHLADVYQHQARYCLMLISAAYAAKVWTNHERRIAQARAVTEKGEYVLPVRFDDTAIPGLPDTIGYLRFADHGVEGICQLLLEKLARIQATRAVTVTDTTAECAYAAPKSVEMADQSLHITQRARVFFRECKRTPPISHGGFWTLTGREGDLATGMMIAWAQPKSRMIGVFQDSGQARAGLS